MYKITKTHTIFNKSYYTVVIEKEDKNTLGIANMNMTFDGQNEKSETFFASDETLAEFNKLMR